MIKKEKVVKIDEIKFINLTPQTINLILETETIKFESAVDKEFLPRCSEIRVATAISRALKINNKKIGEVLNLPEEKINTYYLVSNMIVSACPNRTDLLAPDEIVRDENGLIIGCKSFSFQEANKSDGYHTFDELYEHRMVLFSLVCNANKKYAWKSKLHSDGTMFDNYFIAGINTIDGQYTYHYHMENWDRFNIKELEKAPVYDGHKPSDI